MIELMINTSPHATLDEPMYIKYEEKVYALIITDQYKYSYKKLNYWGPLANTQRAPYILKDESIFEKINEETVSLKVKPWKDEFKKSFPERFI